MAIKYNKKRIATTYWLFIGLMIFCLSVLVLKTILVHTDTKHNQLHLTTTTSAWIDGLPTGSNGYNRAVPLEGCRPGLRADAHFSQLDLHLHSDNGEAPLNSALRWSIVLDYLNIATAMVGYLLGILCAFSFYRSLRVDSKIQPQYIRYLWWVGITIILSALIMLAHNLLQSVGVKQLVPGSIYTPNVQVNFEVSQIVFGLVVLFLSQVLRINHNLQEEQELTI